jgi:hypothetical protein
MPWLERAAIKGHYSSSTVRLPSPRRCLGLGCCAMSGRRTRAIELTGLAVCVVGAIASFIPLIVQHGSEAWPRLVLAIATGTVVLAGLAGLYYLYSSVMFNRASDSALRNASAASPAASPDEQGPLKELLRSAATDVAREQDLDQGQVRSALFRLSDGFLQIVPGLTWNLDDPQERQIKISPGQGSAGHAFAAAQPNIAIYANARDDTSISDTTQRFRVDPELKWIISIPILDQDKSVLAILNVDGLRILKARTDLENSIGTMLHWAKLAGLLLGVSGMELTRGGAYEAA